MAKTKITPEYTLYMYRLTAIYPQIPVSSPWQTAFEQLSQKDRTELGVADSTKRLNLPSILATINEKKEQCEKKQWVLYVKKTGDKVKLREILSNIAESIDKFKEVGDVAVQYDPAHAALPWAAVRFILQVESQHCPPSFKTKQ